MKAALPNRHHLGIGAAHDGLVETLDAELERKTVFLSQALNANFAELVLHQRVPERLLIISTTETSVNWLSASPFGILLFQFAGHTPSKSAGAPLPADPKMRA